MIKTWSDEPGGAGTYVHTVPRRTAGWDAEELTKTPRQQKTHLKPYLTQHTLHII